MTFQEKLGLSNVSHKIIYELILYLICNDWKQILRPKTPPKFILKAFFAKIKALGKKMFFILQSSTIKYNKPFKLQIYIYR